MRIHPTKYQWGRRKGNPWTHDDVTCALFLRHCGLSNENIAAILNRTVGAVHGKIGYDSTRRHAVTFEAARLVAAHELGAIADSYLANDTAGAA